MKAEDTIKDHPEYKTLSDNCQKFARDLINRISPGAMCPDTIQNVLQRLFSRLFSDESSDPIEDPQTSLESLGSGSDGNSRVPSTSTSSHQTHSTTSTYVTAKSRISIASGETWITVASIRKSEDRQAIYADLDNNVNNMEQLTHTPEHPFSLLPPSKQKLRWLQWVEFWNLVPMNSPTENEMRLQIIISDIMQFERQNIEDFCKLADYVVESLEDDFLRWCNVRPIIAIREKAFRHLESFFRTASKIFGSAKLLLLDFERKQAQEGAVIRNVGVLLFQWLNCCESTYDFDSESFVAGEDIFRNELRLGLRDGFNVSILKSELLKVRGFDAHSDVRDGLLISTFD